MLLKSTRSLAFAGIIIALQVITLLIIYVIPTIKFALLFAVSLYIGIIIRIGIKKKVAVISYIASSLLVLFLIRIADIIILYIAFFGWYGIVHESTKHFNFFKKQLIRWICFLISAILLYLAVTFIISFNIIYALWIYSLAGIAVFILLQILYELCIREIIKLTGIKIINDKLIFKK